VAGPVLGGLIGVVAFASSLGFALVDPRFIDWVMYGDLRIHFLGWHTYRGAPWQWPIGANPFFGYPVGTSVALTDSLPLMAAAFKAIDPLLPTRFQYIGLWLLLCFVLQGVFGALLMRVLTPRVPAQALGSTLFVLAPVLIHRTGHPALTAHWLLLAALWLHVKDRDVQPLTARRCLGWAAIVTVAAATHAYLTFMVVTLAAAHLGGQALGSRRNIWRAAVALGGILTIVALVAWQAGYFVVERASDLERGDLGNYSIDMRAPLTPLSTASSLGRHVLPTVRDAPEPYAYLGLGVLLLLAVALGSAVATRHRFSAVSLARQGPLVITLAGLTVMALGPTIRAGGVTLVAYDVEWWGPLAVFRANHRMFWPTLYALTFVGLAGVCRLRPAFAVAVIAGAVAVQAADLGDAYTQARRIREAEWRTPLHDPFWRLVPPQYQRVTVAPTNLCAVERLVDFEPMALITGDFRLPLNAGAAARFSTGAVQEYCNALAHQIAAGTLDSNTLYVFQRDLAADWMPRMAQPTVCIPVNGYVACTTRESYVRWQHLVDATAAVLPPVEEFLHAAGDLEAEYVRMGHTPVSLAGTIEERVGAIRMYLLFRLTGCDHVTALDKIIRTLAGEHEPRACGNPLVVRSPLPGAEDTFAFRRALETHLRALGRPAVATRLDLEGEAVWLHEYARARLDELSDEAAQDRVRKLVRRAANR
jgi:hypothetical protein